MIVLHPGDYASSKEDLVICTVLGSCIAVVLWDRRLGFAGMNHFMLPRNARPEAFFEESGKYGINAMELLINDMLKKGSRREDLDAKVFGGGHVLATVANSNIMSRVPENNIAFALKFLKDEGFKILSSDVGGSQGRKIFVFATSGKVLLKRLGAERVLEVEKEEEAYEAALHRPQSGNNVTLF